MMHMIYIRYINIHSAPIDPFYIANILGIKIQYRKTITNELEFIEDNPVINISTEIKKTKQRFICAHNIGRIILDLKNNKNTILGFNPYEMRANMFALQLLVPKTMYLSYRMTSPDINLSKVFDVSDKLIKNRNDYL